MKTKSEMIQLYLWSAKRGFIESQYGVIRFEEWIRLEAERFEKDPSRKGEIRERSVRVKSGKKRPVSLSHQITLLVNDVGVPSKDYYKKYPDRERFHNARQIN